MRSFPRYYEEASLDARFDLSASLINISTWGLIRDKFTCTYQSHKANGKKRKEDPIHISNTSIYQYNGGKYYYWHSLLNVRG